MTENIEIYSFGDFVLNPARRELKCADKSIEIEPRAFDLLVYLVMNRDRAVDKAELQDAVWPGMIVTETALTRAIMKARKAVNDDASQQGVIKTLHGHGYRFVAELSLQADATPPAESRPAKRKLHPVVLVILATVLIVGLAWLLLRSPPTLGEETRIAVLPLLDRTENPELAWTSLGLMSYASKLIANNGSMPIVPEGSIVSLADSFDWNGDLGDPASQDLLSRLRRVYGATHILAMELEAEGSALRMNYGLLSPDGQQQSGTIVGDEGTALAQGVVQAVYGSMFRKSHLGGDIPLVSKDPFNNEAFARGMALSLQGRCAEAVQFFRVIIEQEPGLFAPRFEYASCLRILGESEEAESLLKILVDEQSQLTAGRPLAQSLVTLGVLYNRTGRLDLAQSSHEEALSISEAIGDHELSGNILQNLSIVFEDRSDLPEAEKLLDLAVLAYQEAGREVMPGQLYSGKANIAMSRGELVEADTYLKQALAAFREIGDRRNEAMMLNNTGYLRRRQGRLDEAEEFHLRSLEIREEIGDRVGVGRIYGMLGVVYTARGQYEDAISAAEAALAIARETRDRLFEGTSLAHLAAAKKAIGDLQAARSFYVEGRAVFEDIQDRMRVLQSDLQIARLDLMENQAALAETTTLRVLEESRELDIVTSEVEALELLGEIELSRDDLAAAIAEYRSALSRVGETTWASKENTLNYKLANTYMDVDDMESAAPLIGALAGQEANVQSLKTQARFAFLRGDSKSAVALMEQARVLAGEHWENESEAAYEQYKAGINVEE